MSGMVERVARAVLAFMVEEDPSTTSWDNAPVQGREGLMRLARVAIKAMREPTEAMIDAVDVSGETDAGGGNNATYLVGKEEAAAVWRAMIDEALK